MSVIISQMTEQTPVVKNDSLIEVAQLRKLMAGGVHINEAGYVYRRYNKAAELKFRKEEKNVC